MTLIKSKLIGKKAYVKDSIDSIWAGEWGIIKAYDGEAYYLAIANGNEAPIFSRDELYIPRGK